MTETNAVKMRKAQRRTMESIVNLLVDAVNSEGKDAALCCAALRYAAQYGYTGTPQELVAATPVAPTAVEVTHVAPAATA